jgi:hypothetical protein
MIGWAGGDWRNPRERSLRREWRCDWATPALREQHAGGDWRPPFAAPAQPRRAGQLHIIKGISDLGAVVTEYPARTLRCVRWRTAAQSAGRSPRVRGSRRVRTTLPFTPMETKS